MDRSERQKEGIRKWIKSGGKATCVYPTGFGKTRVALELIKLLSSRFPRIKVLVVVPTTALKQQWSLQLDSWGFSLNAEVVVINSATKTTTKCDLLILDEVHRYASDMFSKIFDVVTYRYILCLTATIERLDGKHVLLEKYAPVVDKITVHEAQVNNWTSQFTEYLVLVDVPDIDKYKSLTRQFTALFENFNYDFHLAMSLIGKDGYENRIKLRDSICPVTDTPERKSEVLKNITQAAIAFARIVQERKKFINNHPIKIEIAKRILKARQDKKTIVFSNNVNMAKKISKNVYTGRTKKQDADNLISQFHKGEIKVLSTCEKLNEGFDSPNVSLGIILGLDSSKVKAVQRLGRCIRKEGNKHAEIFNIVLNNTIEATWFTNSHKGSDYVTINEDGLNKVLRGEQPTSVQKVNTTLFRF